MIHKKSLRLFIGFGIIGAIAAVIDLTILYVLTEYVGVWYFYSAIVSFSIAITINYCLNKFFNFKDENKRIFSQFRIFFIITLIGLLLNQSILYLFVTYLRVGYLYAKAVAIFLVMFFNFAMHKKITFR